MARTTVLHDDPWKQLCSRKGNQQVGLEEVLESLAVSRAKATSLKKEMLDRVCKVARED